ncbi:MAG: fenitrothion hydrolase [Thermoleophilia bacterium]|nr:fenitrothion hydrolase [Thermoleophilia bacterium]
MRRRPLTVLASTAAGLLAAAPAAHAHGIQGRADLPVPLVAFYWAASIVLVVSFVGLAIGWRRPLLRRWATPAVAPRTPGSVGWLAGAVGFLLLILVLATALFGTTDLNRNFAPIAIFVAWWIGIAITAGLLGDLWRAMHPVAFIARVLRIPAERAPWPAGLGIWLAVAGLLVFTWLELVYPTASDVRLVGILVLAWALAALAGMWRFGVERWLDHAEPFAVYTRVLSMMAIRRHGRWSPPFVGLTALRPVHGLVPFVGLLIGTVSYDGLSRTLWWKRRVANATVNLVERGIEPRHAQQLFGTFGLAMMAGLAVAAFIVAAAASRRFGRLPRRTRWGTTAQAFAPSLVPIALAYVVAHYFSFFWFQAQGLIALASDPFGSGRDLFGTADFEVDYSTLSANAIWAVQLGAIVVGHVLGLVLAHDRALEIEAEVDGARGVRSQWPMLVLMILYTVGGLYFLSEGLNA